MKIEIDDLSRPAIHALLNEHLQSMYALSPPESVHALDLEELRNFGFVYCGPFGEYTEDPNSVFMTMRL
jgi:hypothetical protein